MTHQFIQALQKDHQEVQAILGKIQETSEGSVKTKENLFMQLKQELIPHMKGEEKHFYPLLMKKKEAQELGMEAMEEHHVAEIVLKELDSLSKDAKNWKAKAKVFSEIVQHHIEEEEEEVFNTAQELLSEDELDTVMSSFSKEKEAIKKKLK
jgi:hemerythrin-like domain-containing protein